MGSGWRDKVRVRCQNGHKTNPPRVTKHHLGIFGGNFGDLRPKQKFFGFVVLVPYDKGGVVNVYTMECKRFHVQ